MTAMCGGQGTSKKKTTKPGRGEVKVGFTSAGNAEDWAGREWRPTGPAPKDREKTKGKIEAHRNEPEFREEPNV